MNHYGISAIHWNPQRREIDEVQLHRVVPQEREGVFAIAHGIPASYAAVAGLIRGGDTVWVMVAAGPGNYKNTDRVGINIKRGRHEHLYSYAKEGTPTSALIDLPRYRLPDDPPTLVHPADRPPAAHTLR